MALSIFEDDPVGTDPNDPNTVKRYASKKLKTGQANVQAQDTPDNQYSQLSSTMPGKPGSAAKEPMDPDKQEAVRRRLRRQSVS